MNARIVVTLAGLLMAGTVAGCSAEEPAPVPVVEDSGVAEQPAPDSTVSFDGGTYTCEQVTGSMRDNCVEQDIQDVFDDTKDNVYRFVTTNQAGAFADPVAIGTDYDGKTVRFEDTAYAGIVACYYGPDAITDYVDFMTSENAGTPTSIQGADLETLYMTALVDLCPQPKRYGDRVTP